MHDFDWMKMPGVRNMEDYDDPLFSLLDSLEQRKAHLPKPIPWIEPSINMPYLQACQSYLFQSPLASILATGSVLEHTLRLAVIDRYRGKQGAMDQDLWIRFKKFSIGDFVRETGDKGKRSLDPILLSHVHGIIDKDDRKWWKESAQQLRNKAAHLDIPDLIMDIGRREDFVGDYQDTNDPDRVYGNRFWWGAPFHSSDELVAAEFLNQATDKLNHLIVKMGWGPDLSWWKSQEHEYRKFFEYAWDRKVMLGSFRTMQTYWSREQYVRKTRSAFRLHIAMWATFTSCFQLEIRLSSTQLPVPLLGRRHCSYCRLTAWAVPIHLRLGQSSICWPEWPRQSNPA